MVAFSIDYANLCSERYKEHNENKNKTGTGTDKSGKATGSHGETGPGISWTVPPHGAQNIQIARHQPQTKTFF